MPKCNKSIQFQGPMKFIPGVWFKAIFLVSGK